MEYRNHRIEFATNILIAALLVSKRRGAHFPIEKIKVI